MLERLDVRLSLDDAGVRRPERCEGAYVRLLRSNEVGVDFDNGGDAVGVSFGFERAELVCFVFVSGDYELAAARERYCVRLAEAVEAIAAFDAELRLQR